MVKVTLDGSKLRKLRESRGLFLSDIASAIGYKTPTGYWAIESGDRKNAPIDVIYRLSRLFGTTIEDLLVIEELPDAVPGWKRVADRKLERVKMAATVGR